MLWDEIDLERFPARAELEAAAAELFGVARGDVALVDELAKSPPAAVSLELRKTGGDFPFRLGIYLTRAPTGLDRIGVARELAARLGANVLRGSADPNPYARELVEPSGKVRRVALDVALLDERGWPKLDEAASARLAAKHLEVQVARFRHLWAVFQDLDVGVPVTTEPQAKAVGALTQALSRVLHAGGPTREERTAVESAARAVRAQFAPAQVRGPNGLANLLEAAEIVNLGGLD